MRPAVALRGVLAALRRSTPDRGARRRRRRGAAHHVARGRHLRQRTDRAARARRTRGAATSVVFFVDGRQVCAVSQPPFECEWDAGSGVAEHQVRAVANLAGGGRLVQTVRTKALGYARERRRGRRAGHRDGDRRPRTFVRGTAAVRVSRLRGRTAADDHALRVRGRAARARRRHRHQRQHGAGDAEAEGAVKEFLGGRAVARTR